MRAAPFRLPAALLVAGLALAALAPAASAACPSALTGRKVALPAGDAGFGGVQGLPHLPLGPNEYAVTIDDGPDPRTTLQLATILRDRCVTATFFFIGWKAERYPDIVRSVLAMGHHVASHSYNHPDFGKLDLEGRLDQLTKGARAVDSARGDGARSRLVRVPGSSGMPPVLPADLVRAVAAAGYEIAGYDISSEDWRNSPPAESLHRFRDRIGSGGVIVFHDGQPNTLPLLPEALDELEKRKATVADIVE